MKPILEKNRIPTSARKPLVTFSVSHYVIKIIIPKDKNKLLQKTNKEFIFLFILSFKSFHVIFISHHIINL